MAEAYESYFRENFTSGNRVEAYSQNARPSEKRDVFDIFCYDNNHIIENGFTNRLEAFDRAIKLNTDGVSCPECGCKLWTVN